MDAMSAFNYCTCRANKGFTKQGDDWVCANCKLPTKVWLETVTFPRIVVRDKYPALKAHIDLFVQRMNARYNQEIDAISAEYGLPRKNVQDMLGYADLEGKYRE